MRITIDHIEHSLFLRHHTFENGKVTILRQPCLSRNICGHSWGGDVCVYRPAMSQETSVEGAGGAENTKGG